MNPAVVALLVSHDGARWLPAVVGGIRAQTTPVDAVVAEVAAFGAGPVPLNTVASPVPAMNT